MTRIEKVAIDALLGSMAGAFAGVVLCQSGSEKICSVIPGIFDKALENSADHIRARLANSTMVYADIFKDKVVNNADVINALFNNSKVETVMSGIKYLAGKLPVVAEHAPTMAGFSAKLLAATNPLLVSFSSALFDVSKDEIKTALVNLCRPRQSVQSHPSGSYGNWCRDGNYRWCVCSNIGKTGRSC